MSESWRHYMTRYETKITNWTGKISPNLSLDLLNVILWATIMPTKVYLYGINILSKV